ncbi:MAG: FAD:protein FMN transferase [Sarcina sp.]|nr:FAD:protein FMN transferase [Sarcina sp.]
MSDHKISGGGDGLRPRAFLQRPAALLMAAVLILSLAACGTSAGGAQGGSPAEEEAAAGAAQGSTVSASGNTGAPEETAAEAAPGKEAGAAEAASEEEAAADAGDIPEEPYVRDDGGVSMNVFAMDTYMTLLAYGDKAEKAVRAAAKEIHELDDLLSTGKETSEISKINAAGGGKPSEVTEKLIARSLELADKTGGLFDIAIYPVMKAWGFPTQQYRVPAKKELDSALKLADPSAVTLITRDDVEKAQEERKKAEEEAAKKAEEARRKALAEAAARKEKQAAAGATAAETAAADPTAEAAIADINARFAVDPADYASEPSVSFGIKGMEIDLGGIAKGYTGDRVGEIFEKYGIESGIISLGGNVQTFGAKEDGRSWRVAIQNPASDVEYLGVLDVEDKAVVTSGGYERYFEEKGVRYHHIIDPRTGYPADSGLLSATIICDEGILADGLSTSLFIMGREEAEKFWRESGLDFEFILEDEKGVLYVTEGIADSLTTDAETVTVQRVVPEEDGGEEEDKD